MGASYARDSIGRGDSDVSDYEVMFSVFFVHLPIEIQEQIILNLTEKELINAMRTCKNWNRYVINNSFFWKIPMKSMYRRIIWGARKQSKAILTGLLKQQKASVDIPNRDGNNAIWKLSQIGHVEGVKFLLALGAKPGEQIHRWKIDSTENKKGTTSPLWIAASNGHVRVVEALLQAGADSKFQTSEGVTPLWRACHQGHVECVEALLRHSTLNINAWSKWGSIPPSTPMWIAAREGYLDVVKVLIKYKANVFAKSGSGTTPLEAAQQNAIDLGSDFSSKTAQSQKEKCNEVIAFLTEYTQPKVL